MENSDSISNMSCCEKIKRYPLYYFLKFCFYSLIITTIFFIEKFLFMILLLVSYFKIIAVIFQIILHLILLRYLVLKVAFAGLTFFITRPTDFRNGRREAQFIYNQLESIKNAFDLVYDKKRPIQELKHLSVIQRNIKSAFSVIKHYYEIFNEMKIKFSKLSFDQNIFFDNMKNLYNLLEQSEFINLLNYIIKQLRKEKKFSINDLALDEKEKINIDKTQTEKYIESIKSSLDLLKNQLKDYIGEDYYFFSPRYIRNFFKNYLLCSIQQYQIELNLYFKFEERKLITKDGNTLEYIIIYNNARKRGSLNNNLEKKLMIICGPNGEPYQKFSRNILLDRYLTKGIDVLCWNYRGYGFSTGKASFNNLRSDVIELYEEIKKMNIYNKIGVHGISIGGIPCCYLANQKREITLLVSDRNFGQIDYIARSLTLGKYLVILYKFLLMSSSRNVENYIGANAFKIILNDPNDEIVTEEGSLKTLLSEEFCKRYLELNQNDPSISFYSNETNDSTIELESLDNSSNSISSNLKQNKKEIKKKLNDNLLSDTIILTSINYDLNKKLENKTALDILLSSDKHNFINCLINISEALNNKKLIIKKNSFFKRIFNKSKNNDYSNLKEEELQNSSGLCDYIKSKMSSCLQSFRSAGDNLYKLTKKGSRYNQNLFIENFFNNLFIWGTFDKRDDFGCVYHSTENIDVMLTKVIDGLNLFLSSQEIVSYKKINVLKDIEDFYNYLTIIKNKMQFLGVKNQNNFIFLSDGSNYENELIKLGRGNFVWLNCGHNGIPLKEENLVLKHYFKKSLLFKKETEYINNINTSTEKIDDFDKENNTTDSIFEELNTSASNLQLNDD